MNTVRNAAIREWTRLKQNKRDLIIMFGTPLLYLTLFGFMYFYNAVNHINTVIWDQDNTSLSRTVADSFRNSERFNIIGAVESNDELKEVLDSGKARVGVVIPADFMRDVKKQHSSQVLVCVDGTNLVIANSVFSSALEIVQTISGGMSVRIMEGNGSLPGRAIKTTAPVSFRMRIWYNPTNSYSVFLLLGLLGTTVQQVVLLFTSVSVVRDRLNNQLPAGNVVLLGKYVFGKSLPYLIINFVSLNIVLIMLRLGFGVPFNGSIPGLLVLEAFFITGLVALGVFISIISRNEVEATQASMMIAVPSFLLSGYTWPLEAMPGAVSMISRCLPLTYFVNCLRDLALKGIGLKVILPNVLFFMGMAVLLYPAGIWVLNHNLRRNNLSEPPPAVHDLSII